MPTPSIEESYRRRWSVLAVLCLSVVLVVVANMALNVALPTLGRQLHAGETGLAWIVDAYVVCFAGLLLPAGALGDRLGRKGMLQGGLVVVAVAAALGGFSHTVWELIVARSVMGVGAAMVMPGTLSILATVFPPAERHTAIAIWASAAGASVALSILFSGLILEHFFWGAIFVAISIVAAVALVAGWWLLPTSRHPEEARLDPLGAVLSVVGVTGLLVACVQVPDEGWGSALVWASLAGGALGVAGFVWWERRAPVPMLDLGSFGVARFRTGVLAIAGAYFALFGMYFVLTQYLQLVRGDSPLVAGVSALPAGLAQLAVANVSKPLVGRVGLRPVLCGGLLVSVAGLVFLAGGGANGALWLTEAGLGLLGVGIGLTMPPATTAIMTSLPPHKAGVGSAVNDVSRELGGAFGVGVLGSVTLWWFRHRVGPAVSDPVRAAVAKSGLAQALAVGGGPDGPLGALARTAYRDGMAVAMAVGAVCVAAVALAAQRSLAGRRVRSEAAPSAVRVG